MGESRRDPPAFDIPDLELPVAPARQASRAPVRSAEPRRKASEPDPLGAGSGAIEIEPFAADTGSGARASSGAAQNVHDYFGAGMFDGEPGDDFQPGSLVTMDLAGPRATVASGPEWPSGRSPERSALAITDTEVRLGGGYPAKAANPLLLPRYAWQVTLRRRALRELLARFDRELTAAEQRRDELLAAMVNSNRPALENEPRLAEMLTAARRLGDLTGERGLALRVLNQQYQGACTETEARRTQQQNLLGERQAEERECTAELLQRDENHRRAEARQKRLQIEIRSAIDVARQKALAAGLPPGTAQPEEVAKIHELQQKAAELEPELLKLKAARDQAHNKELAAQNAVAAVERELHRQTAEQAALDRQYGQQIDQRAAGLGEAEGELRSALAETGRAVLAMRGGVAVDASALQAIAAADTEVERLTRESELHLRALDACDHAAVQRGYTVAAIALAALLLVFVALMFAAC